MNIRHLLKYQIINYNKHVTMHNPVGLKQKIQKSLQEIKAVAIEGSKSMISDYKHLQQLKSDKQASCTRLHQITHIRRNLYKAIPYVLISISPGSGPLLIAYIGLFPNGIPINFYFDFQYENRQYSKDKESKLAANQLQQLINVNGLNSVQDIQSYILQNRQKINKQFMISEMNVESLLQVCTLLQMEYIQLTKIPYKLVYIFYNIPNYLINAIYWLMQSNKRRQYVDYFAQLNIPTPFPIIYMKQQLLIKQITDHFKHIANEDGQFNKSQEQSQLLKQFSRERGLNCNAITSLEQYQNIWVNFSVSKKLNQNEKLYYSLLLWKIHQ